MNIVPTLLAIETSVTLLIKNTEEIKKKVETLERLAKEQEERRIHAEYNSIRMMGERR